jgi:hypothetical protein
VARIEAVFSKPLRRDIIVLLCIKALALAGIYLLFFAPTPRVATDPPALTGHIAGPVD